MGAGVGVGVVDLGVGGALLVDEDVDAQPVEGVDLLGLHGEQGAPGVVDVRAGGLAHAGPQASTRFSPEE